MAVAETHYYDVMTRYRVIDGGASVGMNRMNQATNRAARSTRDLSHWLSFLPYRFAQIARVGALWAGPIAFAAGIAKGMQAVNKEMEVTLSMSAIIQASLDKMYSMQERWTVSTSQTARHYSQIAFDAASLPGELKDFTMASQLTMGPVMQAHAGQKVSTALRANEKMIANLSIVRTAFGIDPQTAGRQAQFMLGGMGRRQQRLFQMMQPFGIGTPSEFNALSAADRFERLNKIMADIAQNPLVRRKVFELLETQMGTFKDALLGPRGIFGILGQLPYKGMIDGLQMMNKWLNATADKMLMFGRYTGFFDVPQIDATRLHVMSKLGMDMGFTGFGRKAGRFDILPEERERLVNELGPKRAKEWAQIEGLYTGFGPGMQMVLGSENRKRYDELMTYHKMAVGRQIDMMGDPDGTIGGVPDANIQQTIYATIDVKTDDSPEAVALKLERGFSKVARRPTIATRGLPLTPMARSTGKP